MHSKVHISVCTRFHPKPGAFLRSITVQHHRCRERIDALQIEKCIYFWAVLGIFFFSLEILSIEVRKVKNYACKTRIISGTGAVKFLKELGTKRLFMVSDPFFVKNGTAEHIAAGSGAEVIQIYDGVTPDPTVEQVARGTAELKAFAPDTVVALGGGSAMDCCKAMVFFSGLGVKLAAIPTTSGSGSEVTDFAILTHGGIKHPLIDDRLCPDVAILDSDLLKALPAKLIADTGFDVLSHALEGFVAANAGAITDALALDSFSAAVQALPLSYRGNLSVRQKMHTASTMAAMAFNQAGLGLCHAMSHTLGGMFHLPHGRLNAILLPAVISVNTPAASAKYARIARAAGFGGAADTVAVRNLKNGLIRLRKELEMPGTLSQAGLDPRQVWRAAGEIVKATLHDPCCKTNPVQVEDFTVRRVLEEVTGRVG